MWRFLRFLAKFGNLILFLFLEVVAFLIIISLNKTHREISQGVMLEVSGSLGNVQTTIVEYFQLNAQNDDLQARNSVLEENIIRLRDSLDAYRFGHPMHAGFQLLPDSVRKDSLAMSKLLNPNTPDSLLPVQPFKFIPCRAVNNTVRLNYNYITINKGRRHGVRVDMGVISPEGIAGQVIGVSDNFSLALSVLNRKFRLSAEILHNNNVGTLEWEGGSSDIAQLTFIPQTSRVNEGDTVITTGYGTVFPANYMVGVVKSKSVEAQDGFYRIDVDLSTDFNALHHLFLVDFEYIEEISSLDSLKSEQ